MPAHARGGQLERELGALDDQVVVAQRLPLLESHRQRAPESRISAATARRFAAGHVDHAHARQLAHPGELALGVVAGARFIRSTSPSSSSWKPSARRAVSEAPAACARAHLLARPPRRASRSTRSSMRSYSASRSIVRPTSRVGWRSSGSTAATAPRAARARPGRAAPAPARCAGRRWGRSPRPPTAPRSPSRACSAGAPRAARARRSSARAPPPAAAGAGRARPARRAGTGRCPPTTIGRRPAASSPSISAWASSAYWPALKVASSGTNDTSRCSSSACSAGEAAPVRVSQAGVDLQGVGRHRDRVLAAGAQQLGERDRDGGLADAGGPEQRDRCASRRLTGCADPGLHGAAHRRQRRHRPGDRRAPWPRAGPQLILTVARVDLLEPARRASSNARAIAADLSVREQPSTPGLGGRRGRHPDRQRRAAGRRAPRDASRSSRSTVRSTSTCARRSC